MLPFALSIWLGFAIAIGCVLHGLCEMIGSRDEMLATGLALLATTLVIMLRCLHDVHRRADISLTLPRAALVTLAGGVASLVTWWVMRG